MIVVDTNVLAYFMIEGPRTKNAERLRSVDGDWRVPRLFRHEWLNVVSLYLKDGTFSRDEAIRIYRRGVALVRIEETIPDPVRILNLVDRTRCSS